MVKGEGEDQEVPSTASPTRAAASASVKVEATLPPSADSAEPTPTLPEHEAEKREIEAKRRRNLLGFGKFYAYGAMIGMGIQVLIADVAFYIYGYENHWHIPSAAIDVWLGAVVVQVIGVVVVIARSLFPPESSE